MPKCRYSAFIYFRVRSCNLAFPFPLILPILQKLVNYMDQLKWNFIIQEELYLEFNDIIKIS